MEIGKKVTVIRNKDFLEEIKKEQAELDESMKESFRQRDERIFLSKKEKNNII
tara:strand:+ start:353 stop:511 length:159 start_codon:yes stop_codon:yes gene_type:complete